MKKSLITLAVLGAAVALPQVTMADVKVYGQAQVEVVSYDEDANPAKGIEVEDNARGRIGIVASEDLGDNLKGLAKFEFKADTADGSAETVSGAATGSGKTGGIALTPRESFVGLKGSWGQFEMGRLKSEYKYNGGVKYDPFVATSLEARGKGGMSGGSLGHNSFLTDSLAYRVKAGPVKLGITYDPTEDEGKMTAAANFQAKKWEAFVAIVDAGGPSGAASESKVKFGGKVKFGKNTITGQYEAVDLDNAASQEPTYLFLGYQLKLGKNILVAQYGAFDNDTAGIGDADYLTLGIIHKFSKTTRIFGGYRSTSPDTGSLPSADITAISFGIRKDFK